ncbi:MFS transporter [Ornithinimicrobium sp. Y1694]|uniref:MFS transporter n=1 Tax=Ornithinimicrobium sp. Y1694 TaxID=3418590 RepID=UPI003CF45DE5
MTTTPEPHPAPGAGTGGGGRRHTVPGWLAAIAVVLVAVNLRPGASSVGPVLEEVRSGLAMSGATAGVLTALPGFAFGAVGAVAVLLSRRVGMTTGILLGVLAISLGLLLRAGTTSTPLFLLLSLLALAGMAIGNVLVPAWIKRHSRDGGVRLMTVYGTVLILGGALGSATAAPVSQVAGGWWAALGMWGVVAALALLPWAFLATGERRAARGGRPTMLRPNARMRHSPTAVALTVLFGTQAMNAYVQFGWLPQIYRDAGLSAVYAGGLMALLTSLGVVGGLVMPTVIDRAATLAPHLVAMGTLMVAGYLGLLLWPTTLPWLWAVLLGLGGFSFPTAIALITARTRDPQVTAQLSGFVQPVGYVLAAAGPLAVGMMHAATGGWTAVLVLLMLSGIALVLAGLRVARPVLVDDELSPR